MSEKKWLTRAEQLRHPKWLRTRARIIIKYKSTCQHCRKVTPMLQVHHRYYVAWRMLWQYPDWCLIPLCDKPCHNLVHELYADTFQDWETAEGCMEPIPEVGAPEPQPELSLPEADKTPVGEERATAKFAAIFDMLGKLQ